MVHRRSTQVISHQHFPCRLRVLMKPCIHVERSGRCYGHFGDSPPSHKNKNILVGCLYHLREDGICRVDVYQAGRGDWCASLWDTIPPDELWRVRGYRETLFVRVTSANLCWRNTPLEHRYNLHLGDGARFSELEILAKKERLMWEGKRKTFIPFKNPHPQGYQGVWMKLEVWPVRIHEVFHVRDRFSPDHTLEMEWAG